MYKVISLGDEQTPILTSAATNVYYKQIFDEDALAVQSAGDMTVAQQVDFAQKLMFVAIQQAKAQALVTNGKAVSVRDYMRTVNMDMYMDWLDSVDFGDINDASSEVMQAYIGGSRSSSKAKK